MATIYEALDNLVQQMSDAINAYDVAGTILPPSQTFKGWPVAEELTDILGQQQYVVSIYDHGSKRGSRWVNRNIPYLITAPVVGLSANIDLTLGSAGFFGTLPASGAPPLNVHTFVGAPEFDLAVQSIAGDTIASLVGRIVTGINNAALPFVTAAATGNGFTVTGSPNLHVNIGSSGTYGREVDRQNRVLQAVVWAPNYDIRSQVAEAIMDAVGTEDNQWAVLPDGTYMRVRYESDQMVDESQSDYSLYEHHIFFAIELPRVRVQTMTQVLGFQVTKIIDGVTKPVQAGG